MPRLRIGPQDQRHAVPAETICSRPSAVEIVAAVTDARRWPLAAVHIQEAARASQVAAVRTSVPDVHMRRAGSLANRASAMASRGSIAGHQQYLRDQRRQTRSAGRLSPGRGGHQKPVMKAAAHIGAASVQPARSQSSTRGARRGSCSSCTSAARCQPLPEVRGANRVAA